MDRVISIALVTLWTLAFLLLGAVLVMSLLAGHFVFAVFAVVFIAMLIVMGAPVAV